jgi:hypothetical protein
MFLGPCHVECNLRKKRPKKLPIIFHNLKSYDGHIIIKALEKNIFENVFIIPNNTEKYTSFSMRNLVFLDSFQFMNSSLSSLTNFLRKSDENLFEITRNIFDDHWNDKKDLILKKGIYPYDYIDSFEKFEEKILPKKEDFYSTLNFEQISDEEYEHAQKCWKAFDCQNLGDYHDFYLLLDVVLLADVFQNFRSLCYKVYHLEPLHFYSTPGLLFKFISILIY